ncbi:MAG: EAL domain-containing protein [Sulfurimonas sp.]
MSIDIAIVIDTMRKSNYFNAWQDVLLGSSACKDWEMMLLDSSNEDLYHIMAHKLHANYVPYVIVDEYIDEFFRYCKKNAARHEIKNNIAQAYLKKKLIDDKVIIEIEVKKKISAVLESRQELINAHLNWMKNFINIVVGTPQYLELDPTKCTVGKWIVEERENIDSALINKHSNLHSMAQSALRMYKKEDYAYFLLLYTDILAVSYQIRDAIKNIYFERRLTSIYQDPLSGKANYLQLKHDIQVDSPNNSILMFNIKEFKKINLLYGHTVGDKIVITVSQLVSEIEKVANVYRIYADEFALIFLSEDKEKVIEDFKHILYNYEFDVGNEKIFLSFYGSTSKISKHILEYCEYGLMLSKSHTGTIVDVSDLDKKTFRKYANEITLSQKLKIAFLDNRVVPYFQPIMDVKLAKITKYEVLMRIKDIDGVLMYPNEFLSVLKTMYIYPEVTKLMIKKSFEYFEDKTFDFSVNLSYDDISNDDTKAFIIEILKKNQEISSRCTFELLEHETIINKTAVRHFFKTIHSYGAKIALDDFGVGYSNYDTIFQFDIDYIKIDGSLVESILTNTKSRTLIESILTVSKQIKAKVILEYVSSKEIFDVISEMDVDYAQGYYIGKPASSLEVQR